MGKKIFSILKKYISDSDYRFMLNNSLGINSCISDRIFLEKAYYIRTQRVLNLDNPQSFNEKLQWLKLYDRRPEYSLMADKLLAKDYVATVLGEKHVVPLLGAWDNPDDIDFDVLPNQFVLKCNHNSGEGLYICKNKQLMDRKKVIRRLKKGIRQNYFILNREWCYKNIKKKIIAEKFIEDHSSYRKSIGSSDGLVDYKFYCFNGIPKFFYIGFANITNGEKNDKLSFLTLDWEKTPFSRKDHGELEKIPPKPNYFTQMVEAAAKLSKNIPFVRVDFFGIEDYFYFSEFTFSPGAGYGLFYPDAWEKELGDWIILPEVKNE